MTGLARMLAMALLLLCAPSWAHRSSEAFLTLQADGRNLSGHWEIALTDLDVVSGLDSNGDRILSWGEIRRQRHRLDALLAESLRIRSAAQECPVALVDVLINDRLDGRYAWLELSGRCPQMPESLSIDYRLLFDINPAHRGFLVLRSGATTHSAVLGPDQAPATWALDSPSPWRQFRDYFREGVHHIWIGVDHVLFLLTLLLPCVLVRRAGPVWQGAPAFAPVLRDVVALVTAFTAGHSITLSLAALDVLRIPIALAESLIALSVAVAALNNLWPVVTRRRWLVAFAFGLVHGFGFASVLSELGLPSGGRLLALCAFNLGIETGQLAILAGMLPLLYGLRQFRLYRALILPLASVGITLLAGLWFAQRSGLLMA